MTPVLVILITKNTVKLKYSSAKIHLYFNLTGTEYHKCVKFQMAVEHL